MGFTVANFNHVAEGLQEDQFMIGERSEIETLDDLDPIYRRLLDEPVTGVLAVTRDDGRTSLTPVWIGYDGDRVLFNLATHRRELSSNSVDGRAAFPPATRRGRWGHLVLVGGRR